MSSTTLWHRKETRCPICKTSILTGQQACPECGEDLTPLLLIDSISDSYYNEGLRLASEGNMASAIEQMLKALAFDPKHLAAGVALGKLYAQTEQYAEAAAAWNHVLALDPENAPARAGLQKLESVREERSKRQPSRLWLAAAAILALLAFASLALWRGYPLYQSQTANIAPTTTMASVPTAVAEAPPKDTPVAPNLAGPVTAALRSDAELSSLALDVRQDGPIVYVRGAVQTPDQKQRAETLAKGVAGVTAVDSTGLAIVSRPLAQSVEQALKAEPQLTGAAIAAKQVGDVVRLTGTVPSTRLKTQAEAVAGKVSGVTLLDSRDLLVQPPALDEAVRQALRGDPQTVDLNVSVEQAGAAAVKLSGNVPTFKARLDAETVARKTPGVELLDSNGLSVQPDVREITIQSGDTLTGLAQQYYGDPAAWRLIYEANRLALSSPGLIRVGARLILP